MQFGPLALLSAVAMRPVTTTGGWMIATWSMTLTGLAVLAMVEHVVRLTRPEDDTTVSRATLVTMLIGGGSFLWSWELLAVHFAHLDDVLALLLLTSAVVAVVYRAPILAGVCVGLATDAKPWALACAAVLLAVPKPARLPAIIAAVGVIGIAWLLGDAVLGPGGTAGGGLPARRDRGVPLPLAGRVGACWGNCGCGPYC